MSDLTWTKGTFEIALGEDHPNLALGGITRGPFGIFWDPTMPAFSWSVTHLKTGWNIGYFKNRDAAKAYAEAVTPLLDWEQIKPQQSMDLERAIRPIYEQFPTHRPLCAPPRATGSEDGGS